MGFYTKNGGLIGTEEIPDKRGVYDMIASQILGDSLFPFSSHSFTNASTTGRNGPTLSACQTAYSGAAFLASYFSVTNGIQRWTVPDSGSYTFTIRGAGGGNGYTSGSSNNVGGFGRILTGSIQLTKGDQLDILIGQQGTDSSTSNSCGGSGGGGGGGTFVYNVTTSTLLLVAGGGGGGATWTNINSGTLVNLQHAPGTNDGLDSLGSPSNPTGGTNGGGGTGARSSTHGCVGGSGGGGGFSGDGTYGYGTDDYGRAFNNSSNPGQGGGGIYRVGGFGGGGGSGFYTGGGGGGYSGGAGGGLPSCACARLTAGGGGGSYYNATFVTLTSNVGGSSQSHGIFTLTA